MEKSKFFACAMICVTAPVSVNSNFVLNIPSITGNVFKRKFVMYIFNHDISYFKQEAQI